MVDITGLNKDEVLLALYKGSHAQGLSILGVPNKVDITDAKAAINRLEKNGDRLDFDYWNGHVMKVDITDDFFDECLYDRDNYPGAAEFVIMNLRKDKY